MCGNLLKINGSRDSVIFRFRKVVVQHKIMNKTRSTKNQEKFVHFFGDNYLANHLVKFLQDMIKP